VIGTVGLVVHAEQQRPQKCRCEHEMHWSVLFRLATIRAPVQRGASLVRYFSLYEYQVKRLLTEHNLNVPRFQLVDHPQDAERVADEFSCVLSCLGDRTRHHCSNILVRTIAFELTIRVQRRTNDNTRHLTETYRTSE
jgi:hypothetical protein